MPVTTIASDSLIAVDQHFRVAAGPGAGKTHWLVEHIKNVLQHSRRLGRIKKIACITYTNVAVDTIVKRLDFVADRVDVSTIHSFIYKNIVKPYVSFIAAEYDLDAAAIDGHEDMLISRTKVKDWVDGHPNVAQLVHPYSPNQLINRAENLEALTRWLSSITFELNGAALQIQAKNGQAFYSEATGKRINLSKVKCLDILSPGLLEFKKIYWRRGILHHDDVLFFGYQLLQKFPFIVTVLQGKFPYFFIDEFQDTSPIQNAIVQLIAQKDVIVGVIGDKAQSIYSFQGASPGYFDSFALPGLRDYLIADNRRSTKSIVDLLNHIRTDISQNPVRGVAGDIPVLLIGSKAAANSAVATRLGQHDFTILSRDNITSNAMKQVINSAIPSVNLISELSGTDSDHTRRSVTISCIKSVELARQKRFKDAIKEMEKNFYSERDKSQRKKMAFRHLAYFLSNHEIYRGEKLLVFCNMIREKMRPDLAKLSRGAAYNFCDTKTYEQLAVCVNIADDSSQSRTVHKAKGDEFDDVLVLMKDEVDLGILLKPNLSDEEQRVWYVAASRAKNRLFINLPELDPVAEANLPLSIQVVRMP